jgi:hypothetical protein
LCVEWITGEPHLRDEAIGSTSDLEMDVRRTIPALGRRLAFLERNVECSTAMSTAFLSIGNEPERE